MNITETFSKIQEIVGERGKVELKNSKVIITFVLDDASTGYNSSVNQKLTHNMKYTFNEEKKDYIRTSSQSQSTFSISSGNSGFGDNSNNSFSGAELGMLMKNVSKGFELQQIQHNIEDALHELGWEERKSWLRKKLGF